MGVAPPATLPLLLTGAESLEGTDGVMKQNPKYTPSPAITIFQLKTENSQWLGCAGGKKQRGTVREPVCPSYCHTQGIQEKFLIIFHLRLNFPKALQLFYILMKELSSGCRWNLSLRLWEGWGRKAEDVTQG